MSFEGGGYPSLERRWFEEYPGYSDLNTETARYPWAVGSWPLMFSHTAGHALADEIPRFLNKVQIGSHCGNCPDAWLGMLSALLKIDAIRVDGKRYDDNLNNDDRFSVYAADNPMFGNTPSVNQARAEPSVATIHYTGP